MNLDLKGGQYHRNEGSVSPEFTDNYGIKGLTLKEALKKNEIAHEAKNEEKRSNNIERIKKIMADLKTSGYHKFKTFFSYYDALFNKRVYDTPTTYIPGTTEENKTVGDNKAKNQFPLNTILYGPPGTGKTYQSIAYAVAIIENKTVEAVLAEERKLVKFRFDNYIEEGLIAFTTFHQSMCYEDFIEGIKPNDPREEKEEEEEEDKLSYSVKDGIFKTLCTNAAFSFIQNSPTTETEKAIDFSTAYDSYIDLVLDQLAQSKPKPLKTKS